MTGYLNTAKYGMEIKLTDSTEVLAVPLITQDTTQFVTTTIQGE